MRVVCMWVALFIGMVFADGISGIATVDERIVYVVHSDGRIWRSTDQGQTFILVNNGSYMYGNSIAPKATPEARAAVRAKLAEIANTKPEKE